MGNSVTKKFDVPKEHTATAGHQCLWKIWPGKSKDASGANVSIWAFDKTELAKKKTPSGATPYTDKAIVEQVYQIMRKDMMGIKEMHPSNSVLNLNEVRTLPLSLFICLHVRTDHHTPSPPHPIPALFTISHPPSHWLIDFLRAGCRGLQVCASVHHGKNRVLSGRHIEQL